jgi:outer membrane usher protein FimD/PapC
VQYNFPRAVARVEYVRVGDSGGYQLGLSGAIAAVGGAWGFSRPITDSFGFVKVGDFPDVSVYSNNLFSGKTRSDGTLFIPRLASHFENPIAIDDRELPMNVVVPELRYVVVPAYRSGVFLEFKARRVLAVAGRLALHRGGAREGPFGQATGEVRVGDRPLPLYTSRDGSFYVEDVGPGDHPGTAQRGGQRCAFTMRVPETKDTVAELGEVRCDENH